MKERKALGTYNEVLLAVLLGSLVAYFMNLFVSESDLFLSLQSSSDSEILSILFYLLSLFLLFGLMILVPLFVIQRSLLRLWGEEVSLFWITAAILLALLLSLVVSLIVFLVFILFDQGQSSLLQFLLMLIYYLGTSLVAAYLIYHFKRKKTQ